MNLQPRKRADVAGMLRHDFRRYAPDAVPVQIDPDRMTLNRVLYGDASTLDNLPQRQPDTGRKIRKDANVAASLICTLPQEIPPDNELAVDAWTQTTLQWLQQQCPGQLAYAVLHMDESRPHIHAAVIPVDPQGHLSYKVYFNGAHKLRDIQRTYAQTLEPLGVASNSELVKAVRRTQYTKGIDGWRVPGLVHTLDAREHALEVDLQSRAAQDRPLGQMPAVKAGDFGSAQRYRQRVEGEVLRVVQAREAQQLQLRRDMEHALRQSQDKVRMLEQKVVRQERAHTRYREAVERVLTPMQRERMTVLTRERKRTLNRSKAREVDPERGL